MIAKIETWRVLTQNIHHSEAIVEGHSNQKPADAEFQEGIAKSRCNSCHETDQVRAHYRRDSAVFVRYPSENQTA